MVGRLRGAGLALLACLGLVAGCDSTDPGPPLRIAAGSSQGVYHGLATLLSSAWHAQLGIAEPRVLETSGSPYNMTQLVNGDADVAFSTADVASRPTKGARSPRALARIHDDYLHVVVHDQAPVTRLADLRGLRVAVGSAESGVEFMTRRVLEVSGVRPDELGAAESLGLDDSIEAFKQGRIDAFFWSGGLPTRGITDLAAVRDIRLLDLAEEISPIVTRYPVYISASIPASMYRSQGGAVNTLAVPNFLLVTDAMPEPMAMALVGGMFAAQPALARLHPAALSIDAQSAIETDPLPLHPGAARYYRDEKV